MKKMPRSGLSGILTESPVITLIIKISKPLTLLISAVCLGLF